MGVFWIGVGWLAVSAVVGVLVGRAITFASDGRLAARSRRVPQGVRGALIPKHRGSAHLRLVTARHAPYLRSSHLPALALLVALGGCAMPTSDEPRVTAKSGTSATIEYSAERAGEADGKARAACAESGKQASRASTRPGATGGAVRTYDCTP